MIGATLHLCRMTRVLPGATVRHTLAHLSWPVLCAACNSDDGNTTGRFIDYHVEDGLQACGQTPAFLNDFVPLLADELGLEIESRVDYHWVNPDGLAAACPAGAVGCYLDGQVYARNPALLHEVVHAVTDQSAMNNLPFFTEGLAVAYDPWSGEGAGPRFVLMSKPGEPEADPRGFMMLSAYDFSYHRAGSFVTFLLLRHGPERFVDLSRRLNPRHHLSRAGAGLWRGLRGRTRR